MNDLEIERRIADIEGVHYIETKYDKNNFLALVSENDYTGSAPEMIGKYSPLTDDGLCFRFCYENEIIVRKVMNVANGKMMWSGEYYAKHPKNQGFGTVAKTPNKAVCLEYISAHKDV